MILSTAVTTAISTDTTTDGITAAYTVEITWDYLADTQLYYSIRVVLGMWILENVLKIS